MTRRGENKNHPWYSQGLSFECTQCGCCCSGNPGFVWVGEEEIRALATRLEFSSVDDFERKFVRQVGLRKSLVEYPDGDCIFLDPEKRSCTVYEHRPTQCRTWPFWEENLESPKTWKEVAKSCPGCDQGRVYSLQEIEFRKKGSP